MPPVSPIRHRVGQHRRLDAQHIHIHNHIAVGKKRPRAAPKPKMVDASTQTSAADIIDIQDPRQGFWPKVRRFRYRTQRGLHLTCHLAWQVLTFYARRITLGINLADAFLGRGR